MTVILPKTTNYIFLTCYLLFTILIVNADNCNRETLRKKDKQNLPKEVCIPVGHIISYVYTTSRRPIDFNQDGLYDYIFTYEKPHLKLGDSVFIAFYQQNPDSSFSFTKKFGNIYPVQFDLNENAPKLNPKLDSIFNCYLYPNPLHSLEIKKDTLIIIKKVDVYEKIGYYYKYNSRLKDYVLVEKDIFLNDNITEIPCKKGALLSEFSYCADNQ